MAIEKLQINYKTQK